MDVGVLGALGLGAVPLRPLGRPWSSRWFWVPVAPRVAVVTYSPALVAFVGGGPGFSVSVGVGTDYIGWFPLAPRDPLIPWWGRPATTVVNVTNITYVNRTYVTVVNQNTFVSSRAVTTNYVRDKAIVNRIEQAPVVRGAIPIAPTRESIRVTSRQAAAPRPPAAVASRAVVTRMAPPPAPPRFDTKAAVIRENRGRPVTTVEAERIVTREGREAAQPAQAVRPRRDGVGTRHASRRRPRSAKAPKPEPVAPGRGDASSRPRSSPLLRRGRLRLSEAAALEPQRGLSRSARPGPREQAARAGRSASRPREAAGPARAAERQLLQREQAEKQKAQREQAEKQKAQREQAERQQAQRERSQREQAEKQQAQREQAAKQQAQREQAAAAASSARAGAEAASSARAGREAASSARTGREAAVRPGSHPRDRPPGRAEDAPTERTPVAEGAEG